MRTISPAVLLVATLSLMMSATTGMATENTLSESLQPDANETCTTQTIAGEYGFRTTGVAFRPDGTNVEFASFGRMVRDGDGNVTSGMVTSNTGGTVTRSSLTGTVTVNSDCTGSGTSNLSSGPVVHYDFVIVDKGQRLEFILTEPTSTIGGTQTRQ
jgi:hypothetical protein